MADFGKYWKDLKKHEKRQKHWLPHIKTLAQKLGGARSLRYFTLCARPMIDVFMLVKEGHGDTGLCILILRLAQHGVAQPRAEELRCVEVDLAPEQTAQLVLQAEEAEAGHATGLELDQDVDVAVRPEVRPQDGAEHRSIWGRSQIS